MLKLIFASIAVLAITSIIWPTLKNLSGNGENEAARLANASERAENKAQDVGQTYKALIPGHQTNQAHNPASTSAPPPSSASSLPALAPAQQAPSQPPTGNPQEHVIQSALNKIREMEQAGITSTQYIDAVKSLQAEWNPLYQAAVEELRRLEAYVENAGKTLEEYLELQQLLTDQIHDSQTRQEYAAQDRAESLAWREWLRTAQETLGEAQAIGEKLEDVNIIITKTALSAQTHRLFEKLPQLPQHLAQLERQLDRFKRETDAIRQELGSQLQN